jgi:cell division protein ZapA (FtsZ GTPase activity inhibitor)
MTRNPRILQTRIAGASLDVPIIQNEETTRTIIAQVQESLNRIEQSSNRIDTQAFALRAAIEFAAELHALKAQYQNETHEILAALDNILTRLRQLAENLTSSS